MKTVKDLLKGKGYDIWAVAPDDSVYDALKLMAEKNVGAVLVIDAGSASAGSAGTLVGIVSERDYARKVILEDRRSKDTLVKEIMTEKVFHVSPGQKIDECMKIMSEHHIRHLPVVNESKLTGMISVGDVVGYIISEQKSKIEQLEKDISWGESY